MDQKTLETLEGKFKEVVDSVFDQKIKGVVDPLVEEKVKAALSSLTIEKIVGAKNRSGLSLAAKQEFSGKIKALSEGTGSAGGFVVSEETQAGIARIAEDYGLIRRFATRLPMKKDTLNATRLSASVSVSWPGENTAPTPTDWTLANVQLLAKTAVGLTYASNELLEDADIDVVDTLLTLFAEALAGEEDKQGLVGSGSPFTGVLNDTGVTTVTMAATKTAFTDLTADNLRDMISQVKPLALGGAAYIMHRTVFGIAQKLKDTNGNYLVTNANPTVLRAQEGGIELPAGLPAGWIWGYPVYLSEQMPSTSAANTKFVAFGSLKHVFLGDRKQMTVAISDGSGFDKNQRGVRVTERVAIAVGLPAAFAVLKTAAS
jgi:HK97 family phage major capsid protein